MDMGSLPTDQRHRRCHHPQRAAFATPAITGHQADPTTSTWAFSTPPGIAANGSGLGNPAAAASTQAAYVQGTGSFSEVVNFSGGMARISPSMPQPPAAKQSHVLVDGKSVYGGSGLNSSATRVQPHSRLRHRLHRTRPAHAHLHRQRKNRDSLRHQRCR